MMSPTFQIKTKWSAGVAVHPFKAICYESRMGNSWFRHPIDALFPRWPLTTIYVRPCELRVNDTYSRTCCIYLVIAIYHTITITIPIPISIFVYYTYIHTYILVRRLFLFFVNEPGLFIIIVQVHGTWHRLYNIIKPYLSIYNNFYMPISLCICSFYFYLLVYENEPEYL